ncbi:hypothetical protein PFNF135_04904 [Plasmodium falciparum NF135/5.C10]|uniref:Uncharacterized protein n=2 Tax=Plasmodium falciparum TaxID=5833 RepID=A0A024WJL7_PLAFA|nr:hypothetical protein PFNF135_04904 [Plasmodium falciparum NF135/5.C10]ETW47399.1 hypothetical protein PFMALIP_04578 [Plasmodium falciparum MaliPS096_E11]
MCEKGELYTPMLYGGCYKSTKSCNFIQNKQIYVEQKNFNCIVLTSQLHKKMKYENKICTYLKCYVHICCLHFIF